MKIDRDYPFIEEYEEAIDLYCDDEIDDVLTGEDFLDQHNREDLDEVVNSDDFDEEDEYYNELQASGVYPAYADWSDEEDEDFYLEIDLEDEEEDEDFF
jgi:hypothetical protein